MRRKRVGLYRQAAANRLAVSCEASSVSAFAATTTPLVHPNIATPNGCDVSAPTALSTQRDNEWGLCARTRLPYPLSLDIDWRWCCCARPKGQPPKDRPEPEQMASWTGPQAISPDQRCHIRNESKRPADKTAIGSAGWGLDSREPTPRPRRRRPPDELTRPPKAPPPSPKLVQLCATSSTSVRDTSTVEFGATARQ